MDRRDRRLYRFLCMVGVSCMLDGCMEFGLALLVVVMVVKGWVGERTKRFEKRRKGVWR